MPLDEDLAAWLTLSRAAGLGGEGLRRLLRAFGDPRAVLAASRGELARHVAPNVAAAIRGPTPDSLLRAAENWLQAPTHRIVTLADAEYPPALLQIADPPPLLYLAGRPELIARPSLAIVGSRSASAQGRANAEAFARTFSEAGLTIVSGLAMGIDAAAHRGALAGPSSTVAVLGTGIDVVYPAANRALALAIAERGAIVSELPLGTRPLPSNFPRRNRLISGLSAGCLVVEAAAESGSLITARLAIEQGREVFAIPGSIHSPLSKGCHALIKQGAKLAESAQDVLEELRLPPAPAAASRPASSDGDDALLEAIGYEPCHADTIARRCGLSAAEIAARLTGLELEGKITALPGGLYQRLVR